MDSGYVGNYRSPSNPNGWKLWHRIVKNDVQHCEIVDRPDDRWKKLNYSIENRKTGSHILLVTPSEKPCKFYKINRDQWVKETIETIKKYTDRPIEIRERAKNRVDRIVNDTLLQALDRDVFALVTYNSVAAVESVFYGIPVFTLAPANAAASVGLQDLSQIENPYYPDHDKLFAWACHLSYGQFHVSELKDGSALKILEEQN
jgi:hypothetical protein